MSKGMVPEKGRNLSKYRDGYDGINWKKKPCTAQKTKTTNTKIRSFNGRTDAQ